MKSVSLLACFLAVSGLAASDSPGDLETIETSIESDPDNPSLHCRKCQALFASGKQQSAVDHAAIAMQKFKAAANPLTWIKLGSIQTERHRFDVTYNMGPNERGEKKGRIVRPYSFHVWTGGAEPKLLCIIDFELGYSEGRLLTAAIGETTAHGHRNFGIVDPKSDFPTIRDKVIKIIEGKD